MEDVKWMMLDVKCLGELGVVGGSLSVIVVEGEGAGLGWSDDGAELQHDSIEGFAFFWTDVHTTGEIETICHTDADEIGCALVGDDDAEETFLSQ